MSVAQEKFSYGFPEQNPVEQAKPRRQLSKRAIRKGQLVITGCILALFLTGLTIASYFAQVSSVGYKISRLQSELDKLQTEQEYLESQANQLMSLQRIEAIATSKLGMVKPNPKEVVLVAALPMKQQDGQNSPTDQLGTQGAPLNTAIKKDNLDKADNTKSPVIEAFEDMIKSWEKKL